MNTKFGWHFIGKPPENYRAHCGGSNGIKIVGNQDDMMQFREWKDVFHKQGRLITAEERVERAKERNDLSEISNLVKEIIPLYKGADDAVGIPGIWWEIPPIMPPANEWIAVWNATMVKVMKDNGLRSVAFGWQMGYPEVKPFATPEKPDQWSVVYPALKAIHEAGKDWSRAGFEEYVANGVFDPNNKSVTLRIDYVEQYHLIPNGWDIDFSIIETSFDVPGMNKIKGMSPQTALTTLRRLDAEYVKRKRVAVAFLYAVVDPMSSYGEGDYAFTPGNKNQPMGYLETFETYFKENPPIPFVSSPSDPVPPPQEEAKPVPVIIENSSFEADPIGKWNADQIKIPAWVPYSVGPVQIRFELEEHPPHVIDGKRSARVISSYEIHKGGLYQTVAVPAKGIMSFSIDALSWSLNDPQVGHPTETPMLLRVGIDPLAGTDPNAMGITWSPDVWYQSDQFVRLSVSALVDGPKATVFLWSQPKWPMARNDSFWDNAVSSILGSIESPPTETPKTIGVVINCNFLNVREGPGTGHKVLWQLAGGKTPEQIVIVSVDGGWGRLLPRPQYPNAYVHLDYLKLS